MAGRAAQVLAAVAVIVAVAILARPPDVTTPPPFEVERVTPSPRPEATASPEPPEELPAGMRLAVVTADPGTLAPGERFELGARHSYLASDIDPSGRWLSVATSEPGGTSVIRLVDVVRLGTPAADFPPPARFLPAREPHEEIPVQATVERLRSATGGLVWVGRPAGAGGAAPPGRVVGVVRFDEHARGADLPPPVPLPDDFEPVDVASLGDDHVGVFGYGLPSRPRVPGHRWALGDVRLLVVDVGAGAVASDVTVLDAAGASSSAPLADVAWDPRRRRAYVAGAGGAVSAVDLDEGALGAQLRAPAATPPPAGGALDPGPPGGWRDAALSPDGSRLYVGGSRPGMGSAGGGSPRPARLPLAVFDVEAGRMLDVGATVRGRIAAISPGGDLLAVVAGAPGPEGPQSLVLLDAVTLEQRWRRPLEGVGLVEVEFTSGGDRLVTVHPERTPRPAARLTLIDSDTGAALASRAYDGLPVGMFPATGVLVMFARG